MFKSTIQITLLSFLGIILGFAMQLLVAYYFGTSMERDAYFAAIIIPVYLTSIMNVIGMIFLPIYVDIVAKHSESEADGFFHNTLSMFAVIIVIIIIAIAIFAHNVLKVTAPGFENEQMMLAAELLIILLPTVFLSFNTTIAGSVLQIQKRFIIPAISPVISIIISFLIVWMFHSKIGIRSLAYGTLFGGIANYLFVRIALHKPLKFSLNIKNEHIILLFKSSAPLLLAGIFTKLTGIFERGIASTLPDGSISYLGYANQIMSVLATIVSSGIAITVYPLISKVWSENNFKELNRLLTQGIRIILLMALPVAAIFIFFGTSVIQILLERGAFSHTATVAISSIFAILTIAFVCNSLGNITAKCYYFSHKTVLCVIIDLPSILLYFALAYWLSGLFSYKGIAMAASISAITSIGSQLIFLRIVSKKITIKSIFVSSSLILLAVFIPAMIIALILNVVNINISGLLTFVVILVYLLLYYLMLKAFKIKEINILQNRIITYLSNKKY
jgi:putative peptidoglycan lipid II flippase